MKTGINNPNKGCYRREGKTPGLGTYRGNINCNHECEKWPDVVERGLKSERQKKSEKIINKIKASH